jgi:proline iminopeptidase
MPIVPTPVGPLWVEQAGQGPYLFIAHGGPGLHHGPYRTLDPLGAANRLIYWDHRGHGRSAPLPDGEIGMDLFADDTVRLADSLNIERFALFGHSSGGWVAQETALRHPDRVSALILAATTPGQLGGTESPDDDQGPPPPPEVAQLMAREPASDAEFIEIWTALAPHYMRTADPASLLDELDPELVRADSSARVFAALSGWSSTDRLRTISCPTLVLAGQYDVFCSVPQLERIARRISGAELVVFTGSGHFMWLEEPDRFFPLVIEWLRTR